jgi:excisionase family DNA binding protein
MTSSDLLKTREVAELFGVETRTVLRWHRNGDLPGFRLRGRIGAPLRFRRDDVERLVFAWSPSKLEESQENAPAPLELHRGRGLDTGGIDSRAK